MKTVMQEFEEWIDKNCHKEKDVIDEIWFVSIQHDRLAAKFEEMLKKEHEQMINFHMAVMQNGLESERSDWKEFYEPVVRKVAETSYTQIFNEESC